MVRTHLKALAAAFVFASRQIASVQMSYSFFPAEEPPQSFTGVQ